MKYSISNWLTLPGFYKLTGIESFKIRDSIKKGVLVKGEDYKMYNNIIFVSRRKIVIEKIRSI